MVIETRLEYRGYLIFIGVVQALTKWIYKVQVGREEQGHFVPKFPGFTENAAGRSG